MPTRCIALPNDPIYSFSRFIIGGPLVSMVLFSLFRAMRTHSHTTGNYEAALVYAEKGIVSIPCHLGTKVPCVKWKQWQNAMPPAELLRRWFADTRNNIAIITTGMVVFDCDDPAKADLVLAECGDTPHKLRTPRGGIHLGYRRRKGVAVANQVKIKGLPIAIRTDGGLELLPSSRTEDGEYEWLGPGLRAIAELPVARIGWTRERKRRQIRVAVSIDADPGSLLSRGRLYVDRFERAVSGQHGHTTTFVSALKIVRFVGGDPDLAWQLLCYYNATKCEPEWSETELRHKWEDALKKAR